MTKGGVPFQPHTDIRGEGQHWFPARRLSFFAAFLTDLSLLFLIYGFLIRQFFLPPWLGLVPLIALVVAYFLIQLLFLLFSSASAGMHVWGLRFRTPDRQNVPQAWLRIGLYLVNVFGTSRSPTIFRRAQGVGGPLRGWFVGSIITVAAVVGLNESVVRNPLWIVGPPQEYSYYQPENREDWFALPFYYATGSWPRRYLGRNILYTLPYKKGPPKRFIEKVIARLEMPETFLTIEGPVTPKGGIDPLDLRQCFEPASPWRCLALRHHALDRHFRQIQKQISPTHWEISWFEINDPNVPNDFRTQGIRLVASAPGRRHERFILVSASGRHQTVSLNRPSSLTGEAASALLERTVRSLQMSTQLEAGQSIINRALSETRNTHLNETSSGETLSDIQTILIAKLTVDQKDVLAYYHLGGTALMLMKRAGELRTATTGLIAAHQLLQLDEWSAAAKPIVQSAYFYARDVDPRHPKTLGLEQIWAEARKY